MEEEVQNTLLEIADDELILGWRDSEWTGIAPLLEEDVAFSSIAQNEIGHARALYELVARERGTTADELAFDRSPDEYRCARLVELRLLEWEKTIARHYLYEEADAKRLERLKESDDAEIDEREDRDLRVRDLGQRFPDLARRRRPRSNCLSGSTHSPVAPPLGLLRSTSAVTTSSRRAASAGPSSSPARAR